MKDQFWEDLYPELPYTAATESQQNVDDTFSMGTTANILVKR